MEKRADLHHRKLHRRRARIIQTAAAKVLAAAARGELDLNRLAREELSNRGLDLNGTWVGFEQARAIHNV